MAYDIGQLKDDIIAVLHGTTLNQINGINPLINRAARKLLNEVDPIETMRVTELPSPVYDRIYDYPIPADLKDERIIDLFPQVKRKLRDRFFQQYSEDFDLYKDIIIGRGDFTIEWDTYQKYIRIANKDLPQAITVNTASQITGDGTWSAGGDASDLTVDNLNYIYGSGSLRFTLDAGGSSGYLENSTFNAIDLTQEDNEGIVSANVYLPNPSDISSIELRWGSSPTDYFTQSVTSNFFGNALETGWNLLQFNWASSTSVGTPDSSAITYLRFVVNYNGNVQYYIRLNLITSQLGSIYTLKYYSKYLFRDALTGAFKENVTNDADLINLDTTSYNMLTNLCAYFAMQQQKSNNGPYDANFFLGEYEKERQKYVNKIRSQTIKPQGQYYKMPPKKSSVVKAYN